MENFEISHSSDYSVVNQSEIYSSDDSLDNQSERHIDGELVNLNEFIKYDKSFVSSSILSCKKEIRNLFEKKLNKSLKENNLINYTQKHIKIEMTNFARVCIQFFRTNLNLNNQETPTEVTKRFFKEQLDVKSSYVDKLFEKKKYEESFLNFYKNMKHEIGHLKYFN
jgi:hypothetical protein